MKPKKAALTKPERRRQFLARWGEIIRQLLRKKPPPKPPPSKKR